MLSIKSKDFITFYDWQDFNVVRRIDVTSPVKNVFWSEDGQLVALTLDDAFYLLKFNADQVAEVMASG